MQIHLMIFMIFRICNRVVGVSLFLFFVVVTEKPVSKLFKGDGFQH